MSNSYQRNCTGCGQRIRMAEMESGQWLPFEIDGTGRHDCLSITSSLPEQKPSKQKITPIQNENEPFNSPHRVKDVQPPRFPPLTIWIVIVLIIGFWLFNKL